MNLINSFVQLDPALQNFIALGVTALVSFLLLQLANLNPALAEYLGQYKVAIITWLTGLFIQLAQAGLNNVPLEWETVAAVAMKLLVEVLVVLLGFAAYRKVGAKGYRALLPS